MFQEKRGHCLYFEQKKTYNFKIYKPLMLANPIKLLYLYMHINKSNLSVYILQKRGKTTCSNQMSSNFV